MGSLEGFNYIALLAMNWNTPFSFSSQFLNELTTRLKQWVSILVKHAAITIACTAQYLADFGIVNVLASVLRDLRNSAIVTENVLCPLPRNQSRYSD